MSGRRSDTSLAALLLVQRLVDTGAEPLKANEYWSLLEAVPDPGQLFEADGRAAVPVEFADRVVTLLDGATALGFELERLEQSGLRVVSSFDDDYPHVLRERLGASAPPLLHIAGTTELLGHDALGIVGSRDIAPGAAEVAQQAARLAVERGLGVVSGGAKGIDQLATGAALEAGGHVVSVLADSLLRRVRDAGTRRAIAEGNVVLCTPYRPDADFSVANAMGRNKIVYAMSQTTLVVASDLEAGGTWAGAVEALRRSLTPVVVWEGEGAGAGNHALAERGARSIGSLDELFPLDPRPRIAAAERSQLSLDV